MSGDGKRQAVEIAAPIAAQSLAAANKAHQTMAEMSHMARLALQRLASGTVWQDATAEINLGELQAMRAILRSIQNCGHAVFLRAHGDEIAYKAICRAMTKNNPPLPWRA